MGLFDRFFGRSSKKRDTTFTGQRPFTTLREAALGDTLAKELEARLRGERVGLPQGFVGQATSPIIARMRGQFQSGVIPALESELSRTGRRRGSGGFRQIAQAHQEQGLAEGDVYAQLALKNELLKRQEISDALARMQEFNLSDAAQQAARSAFDERDYRTQINLADTQKQRRDDLFNRLLQGAVTAATSFGAGGFGGGTATTPTVGAISPSQFRGASFRGFQPVGVGFDPTGNLQAPQRVRRSIRDLLLRR